ncbi:hypothetical protein EV401DRAFT_2049029 [Pisolithus croceorrhizus]|nr:hypothetical protein EV401DRAFT_2049029 [Pisolithus croceorrhizus]
MLCSARDDILATLLAIALDPEWSILFHQDHNLHHVKLSTYRMLLGRVQAGDTDS